VGEARGGGAGAGVVLVLVVDAQQAVPATSRIHQNLRALGCLVMLEVSAWVGTCIFIHSAWHCHPRIPATRRRLPMHDIKCMAQEMSMTL
jgi:hypothetical protein